MNSLLLLSVLLSGATVGAEPAVMSLDAAIDSYERLATVIDRLEIRWPGGKKTIERDLVADKILTFREPDPSP